MSSEKILESLKPGDRIKHGCNGRWVEAVLVRVGPVFVSGYGGTARDVEWQCGPTSTTSTVWGSRDFGRFWTV